MGAEELKSLEQRAYADRLSDGLIDLVGGLALALVGASWILAEDRGWIAILGIPICVALTVPLRSRFVESRAGYVRFSKTRRARERSTLLGVLSLGVATLALALATLGIAQGESLPSALAPGLLGLMVATPIAAIGVATRMLRLVGYGAVALAASAAAIATEANPGWPLAITGVVATAVGAALVRRFVRNNPRGTSELAP